ncbi:MAG: DUF1624 domain-containing protein [Cyclobacteriaceae bacterium]
MDSKELVSKKRIDSLDVLRGLIIVLMAIDHVRDLWSVEAFMPEDIENTYPAYYFTRWITHFCAPNFVFLAGTSAFLFGTKKYTGQLSRFLFIRGVWLIFIEIFVVNLGIFFIPLWSNFGFVLQVIWAIGVSMIALSGLVWLSQRWILVISLVMIFGHNLLNFVVPEDLGSFSSLWVLLHEKGLIPMNSDGSYIIWVAYPIIPWIGAMGLGYVFGNVMKWESAKRISLLWKAGLGAIGFFVVLRYLNIYGDTNDWVVQKDLMFTVMDFINTQKYPPSLLFLCMTIGPAMLLLVLFEKWTKLNSFFIVFGKVPFFFYIVHFYFIHATSLFYYKIRYGEWFDLINTGPNGWPDYYSPSLILVYIVWALTILFFYFLCKWYSKYKFSHDHWWLKYI